MDGVASQTGDVREAPVQGGMRLQLGWADSEGLDILVRKLDGHLGCTRALAWLGGSLAPA